LASRGWSKSNIKKYIIEHATAPRGHHSRFYGEPSSGKDPNEPVPLFSGDPCQPPPIQIFVAGGQGSWTGLHSGGSSVTTMKINLPANWDKLVAKYKNIVPVYARY